MGLIAGLYFIVVAVFSTETVPRLFGVALGASILWIVIGNRDKERGKRGRR